MQIPDEYAAILARLAGLHELLGVKIQEHSQLLKEADRAGWDPVATQKASTVLAEIRTLGAETDELIAGAEQILAREGFSLPVEEPPVEEPARYRRKELTTDAVPATRLIEDVLEDGLDRLLSLLPNDWWKEQCEIRSRAGSQFLLDPIALYGNIRATEIPAPIHRFAYAVMLAQDSQQGRDEFDMYEGALLVPLITALCSSLDALSEVARGPEKLQEMLEAPSAEVDSRLYELAVASRAVELGRDVEFLVALGKQTPDLRIHDLGFPAVVECKFQQRLSAYELREFSTMRDVFHGVRSYYDPRGVIGNLTIQFRQPPVEIGVRQIADAAIECQAGMNPYRSLKYQWGDLSLSPLDPTITLPGDTRLYSPDFLNFVFGWDSDTTEYDGILATVRNHRAMRVARAELPLSLQWRVEHESVLDRKARSIASQLAEAHSQIPVGEGGFLYLAYEEHHRNAIADRRTERIIQLMTNWEVRKRGIHPLRIVINRLYPRPIHEGRPDMIESAIRISPYDEDVWLGRMPAAVFTAPVKTSV